MKLEKSKKIIFANGIRQEIDAEKLKFCKRISSDWWIALDNLTPHKYQIAIQCIARKEERYFKEWVEHHLHLGVEHIYIYDNNDSCDEGKLMNHLCGVLSAESFAKIEIIPWHEPMLFQQYKALEDCVSKHKDEVKWLLSIDIDEFLFLDKQMSQFLEEFSYASQVFFCWESFGADGQLFYTDKPVIERFRKTFDCKDGGQGKVMFRPERLKKWGVHGAELWKGKIVNVLHKRIIAPDSFSKIYTSAWLKHYFTKSLEEWTDKINRGSADSLWLRKYSLFFEINPNLNDYYDSTVVQTQKHGNAPKAE